MYSLYLYGPRFADLPNRKNVAERKYLDIGLIDYTTETPMSRRDCRCRVVPVTPIQSSGFSVRDVSNCCPINHVSSPKLKYFTVSNCNFCIMRKIHLSHLIYYSARSYITFSDGLISLVAQVTSCETKGGGLKIELKMSKGD